MYESKQPALNLNEGSAGAGCPAVPFYLKYTTAAEEGDNEIIDIDVIKATDSPQKGWDRIPFNLNASVTGGTRSANGPSRRTPGRTAEGTRRRLSGCGRGSGLARRALVPGGPDARTVTGTRGR
ncbi:hypothetical protein [Streptomyces chrestomyceticus]|uniref:hypothetical protein n=1 Tax=Streptomyces chrestomyceticus TaxID=68185 RepID=UPI0019D12B8F|nr:hypothetical protein [Streptomyces chrestomyceticus]